MLSETHAEGTIHVVRGISYSDEDNDSDDDDLPDVDDFLQFDVPAARPDASTALETPFAEPVPAVASREQQNVPDDASSSRRVQGAQVGVCVRCDVSITLPHMATAPQQPRKC